MKKCYDDNDNHSLISDPLFQRLFRLFLLFAEPAEGSSIIPSTINNNTRSLQYITSAQAHFIINELFHLIRPRYLAALNIPQQNEKVTFRELIELCDLIFPDRKQLEPVVDRVFDRYVSQIVHKGFVMCRKVPSKFSCARLKSSKRWKSYWCTLVPGTIFLWPLHKKTSVGNRITIVLDSASTFQMGPFQEDRFTWELYTCRQKYQFGHFDEIQRQHWLVDMNLVMEYRTKTDLYNFDQEFSRRRENMGKEKEYSWKLALEAENRRLTQMLNEERQALYDEEIVRQLATRMLDDEKERSELLEKQIEELESLLLDQKKESTEEMPYELFNDTSVECMTPTTVNLDESPPTSLEVLDIYKEEEQSQIKPNQLNCLIISTQSI